jgi:dienelactone hydrolase
VSTWRKYVGLLDNLRIYGQAQSAEDIAAEAAAERDRYSSPAFTATDLKRPVFSVPVPEGDSQTMWDMEALSRVPETYPAPELDGEAEEGIRPLFFEGEPYKGNPTRVFAWYGVPLGRTEPGPAMVLVHGGGGTAFKSWVRLWMDRGYAAIAMDTCGGIPVRPENAGKGWKRHEFSGPNGWGGFDNVDDPVHDQWTYHAVAAVVRAHTLMRSFPEVDADRVGLTGISWGGYLTNIVAGVDTRFVFASPVYGCGFLGENSAWVGRFRAMGEAKARRWLTLWDPSQYVCYATLPMLFCNGTNDHFYPMDSWQKTYRAAQGPVTLCCKVRMPHSHPPAGDPPEITAFANAHLRDGIPLVTVTGTGRNGMTAWAAYDGARKLQAAELVFTRDRGNWEKRVWETTPADIDAETRRVTAKIPDGVTVFYINLIDQDELIVSTQHEVLKD